MNNVIKQSMSYAFSALTFSLAIMGLAEVMPTGPAILLALAVLFRHELIQLAKRLKQSIVRSRSGRCTPQQSTSVTVTTEEWDAFIERHKKDALNRGEKVEAENWEVFKSAHIME